MTQGSTAAPHVSQRGRKALRLCQMHLLISLACRDGWTRQQCTPSLWEGPIPQFPSRESETTAKWPPLWGTWEAAPCRVICVASEIFHSSAQIASGIQNKVQGEALVPGIPWISLPTTKGLARAKLCGYCTATLLFSGDKGPFTTAREPWGVGCGWVGASPEPDTEPDSCKQLRHSVPQHLSCSCSA